MEQVPEFSSSKGSLHRFIMQRYSLCALQPDASYREDKWFRKVKIPMANKKIAA